MPRLSTLLTQTTAYLTSSIFEMKDSLNNTGDFSKIQLKNSQDDLRLAVHEMKRIRQEIRRPVP